MKFLFSDNMNKILQATNRGQVTLPKDWRDKFETVYFEAEILEDKIIIKPLIKKVGFEATLEKSWEEYNKGKFISGDKLMKKYGL
jgi:bifunctional DNA-binding transcriptional regulator/antitoxin component of YhaV-PrlF toxin-antitoxin module